MKNIENLNNIIKKKKKINILKESVTFLSILTLTTTLSIILINLSAFRIFIYDLINDDINLEQNKNQILKTNILHNNKKIQNKKIVNDLNKFKKIKLNYNILKKLTLNERNLDQLLRQKTKNYLLTFNTLPPDNKIIISKLNVIAPIIDIKYATKEKLEKGDFDKELFKGVIKYPFTAYPGQTGNTLIFGHTSYYWWKKNPYGEIFSKIPKLKPKDKIQIIRNGKLYEYEVIRKKIIWPSQIEKLYNEYQDGKYLTLIGCYPIGTDLQRILIIAKLKEKSENLAINK